MTKIYVECWRRRELIATYEFGLPATMVAPPQMPDKERLMEEAKEHLTNERLAFPPYGDIEFRIRSN